MPLIAEEEKTLGYAPFIYNRYRKSQTKYPYFEGELGDYSTCGDISSGSSNYNCVLELQGYLIENGIPVTANGVFDSQTLAAVEQFQATRGLKVDGIVGKYTWPALTSFKPAVGTSVSAPITAPKPVVITPPMLPGQGGADACIMKGGQWNSTTGTCVIPPSFLTKYLPYILIGGGGLLLVYFLTMPKYFPETHEKIMSTVRGKV